MRIVTNLQLLILCVLFFAHFLCLHSQTTSCVNFGGTNPSGVNLAYSGLSGPSGPSGPNITYALGGNVNNGTLYTFSVQYKNTGTTLTAGIDVYFGTSSSGCTSSVAGTCQGVGPTDGSGTTTVDPSGSYVTYTYTFTANGNYGYMTFASGYCPFSCNYSIYINNLAGNSCVLPIELLSFQAEQDGANVLLKWSTATEKNNNYFTIERSKDAVNFEEVERVKGAGNSQSKLNYSLTDFSSYKGISYYRLKQTDYDGTHTWSSIAIVDNKTEDGMFTVTPNPSSDIINVNYNNRSDLFMNGTVKIFDYSGNLIERAVMACFQGDNIIKIDITKYPSGFYFVTFSLYDRLYKTKLIKK